ncbi:hypothetical protein [Rathayibacter sp. SD072]|uniref:hypothetical protein n=1 Tax=Rathayibacter sp. SD072 TaxID=2781731 RepID=UPI001A95CD45|nr:hypothetical protein [Rathayibacter sp. SD072]MBO0984535.1 hypothetical protein [Rathayibacter sp. SD072]
MTGFPYPQSVGIRSIGRSVVSSLRERRPPTALDTGGLSAFAIGGSTVATDDPLHLVGARGVPTTHVTIRGYGKAGHRRRCPARFSP